MENIFRLITLVSFMGFTATQALAYESYYVTIKKVDKAPANFDDAIQHVGINNCKPGSATKVDPLVVVLETTCSTQVDFFLALSEVAAVKGFDRVMSITFDPPIKNN